MADELSERVLAFVRENPGCSKREARKAVPWRDSVVVVRIDEMIADGTLDNRGRDAHTRLYVAGDAPETTDNNEPRSVDEIHATYAAKENESRIKREHRQLAEELRIAEARNDVLRELEEAARRPVARVERRERTSGLRESVPFFCASDWHVEETVDPATVMGRNKYNLEIAGERVRRYFGGVEYLCKAWQERYAIRDAVLWLGGDLLSGYIHEELVESNELSPTEAIVWLFDKFVAEIPAFADAAGLERLIIPCNFGNHGRTTDRRRIQTGAQNSYEVLLYHMLAKKLASDPRFDFRIAAGGHEYLDLYGWTVHTHHGDEVRFGGGVGGLAIPYMKRIAKWNAVRHADYHVIGHYHTRRDFGAGLSNGSLIGYNAFAMSIGADFEQPEQLAFLIDAKRGKAGVEPIFVTEHDDETVAA